MCMDLSILVIKLELFVTSAILVDLQAVNRDHYAEDDKDQRGHLRAEQVQTPSATYAARAASLFAARHIPT